MRGLFVKINDEWKFVGFVETNEEFDEFVATVTKDIETTKNDAWVTQAWAAIILPHFQES